MFILNVIFQTKHHNITLHIPLLETETDVYLKNHYDKILLKWSIKHFRIQDIGYSEHY
jgi:hypothetical protein